MDYELREMRKQAQASAGASVEMEFESRSSHFQMKGYASRRRAGAEGVRDRNYQRPG
jgi:hypothetical protein